MDFTKRAGHLPVYRKFDGPTLSLLICKRDASPVVVVGGGGGLCGVTLEMLDTSWCSPRHKFVYKTVLVP